MLFLALLMSCGQPYPGACTAYYKLYCDTCELEDYEKILCKCVQEGKLDKGDFPDGGVSDDEAQEQCDELDAGIRYPTPDQETMCKQSQVLLQKHGKDVCDGVGYYGGYTY